MSFFTRSNLRIPMRDGVELSAEVHLPEAGVSFPTILLRTPYSNGPDKFEQYGLARYLESGYAVVFQHTRGQGKSQGSFEFFFRDADDGYDTVEWIATQPWSNEKVGMDGGSYLGTVQWLAARARPPHLTCIAPTAPAGRFFHEVPYVGGALNLDWALSWISDSVEGMDPEEVEPLLEKARRHRPLLTADEILGRPMPFYREVLSHPTLDDYWNRIQFSTADFENIDLPVHTVTGWFDGDQAGALFYWEGIERGFSRRGDSYLIVGPWTHEHTYLGGQERLGALEFSPDSVIDIQAARLEFFDRYLKGARDRIERRDRVRVYLTGANQWRGFDRYPPEQVELTPLYFHSGGSANTRSGDGSLGWECPADEPPDRYHYDPNDPMPYAEATADCGEAEDRPDVLVYSSDALSAPLDVLGPIRIALHAASDGLDTDFVGRIVDVFPDGRAVNLTHCQGVIRARYRHGWERTELLEPGRPERFEIRLQDIGHRFLPGHRVRIELTSSNFPLVDPNTNTGAPPATDTGHRVAQQTVFHDAERASHVLLPVLGPG